eukprot:7797895-Lingulodinium_polyedra.AAC.1
MPWRFPTQRTQQRRVCCCGAPPRACVAVPFRSPGVALTKKPRSRYNTHNKLSMGATKPPTVAAGPSKRSS